MFAAVILGGLFFPDINDPIDHAERTKAMTGLKEAWKVLAIYTEENGT